MLRVFFRPHKTIFMPQGALTFSALLKTYLLQLAQRDKASVLSVQKKQLAPWQQRIIRYLKPQNVFVLSSAMAELLKQLQIESKVLTVGIDPAVYCPVNDKVRLRRKYDIPIGKRILLHVGHIKESRNIRWLLEIQNSIQDIQIVLVGSTTTIQDLKLCRELEEVRIIVLRDYLPNIQEIYQLSDVYFFPVTKSDGAMELPLSVLEAMATNLPVITTRFGRLPEQFIEDHCYRYVDSHAEAITLLQTDFGSSCSNREKMTQYTWGNMARCLVGN